VGPPPPAESSHAAHPLADAPARAEPARLPALCRRRRRGLRGGGGALRRGRVPRVRRAQRPPQPRDGHAGRQARRPARPGRDQLRRHAGAHDSRLRRAGRALPGHGGRLALHQGHGRAAQAVRSLRAHAGHPAPRRPAAADSLARHNGHVRGHAGEGRRSRRRTAGHGRFLHGHGHQPFAGGNDRRDLPGDAVRHGARHGPPDRDRGPLPQGAPPVPGVRVVVPRRGHPDPRLAGPRRHALQSRKPAPRAGRAGEDGCGAQGDRSGPEGLRLSAAGHADFADRRHAGRHERTVRPLRPPDHREPAPARRTVRGDARAAQSRTGAAGPARAGPEGTRGRAAGGCHAPRTGATGGGTPVQDRRRRGQPRGRVNLRHVPAGGAGVLPRPRQRARNLRGAATAAARPARSGALRPVPGDGGRARAPRETHGDRRRPGAPERGRPGLQRRVEGTRCDGRPRRRGARGGGRRRSRSDRRGPHARHGGGADLRRGRGGEGQPGRRRAGGAQDAHGDSEQAGRAGALPGAGGRQRARRRAAGGGAVGGSR
jgi:hypothetical protein